MALPACLRLSDDVFPRVRALAARELTARGWSQQRTGAVLGLSQASVSKLLAAPSPAGDALAARLAGELVREATAGPEAIQPRGQPSPWCATLTAAATPGSAEALEDVLAAERSLVAAGPLRCMPQVGLNVARALPEAARPEDVLAFPGRLVDVGGRIVSPAPPAPGGSGHLARCLLALRAAEPAAWALCNVRGGGDVAAAAARMGWPVVPLSGSGDVEARFALACRRLARQRGATGAARRTLGRERLRRAPDGARAGTPLVAFHEPGAPGLEPCLYIAAATARAAVVAVQALEDALDPRPAPSQPAPPPRPVGTARRTSRAPRPAAAKPRLPGGTL